MPWTDVSAVFIYPGLVPGGSIEGTDTLGLTFYKKNTVPGASCDTAHMSRLVNLMLDHEGFTQLSNPNSHWGVTQDVLGIDVGLSGPAPAKAIEAFRELSESDLRVRTRNKWEKVLLISYIRNLTFDILDRPKILGATPADTGRLGCKLRFGPFRD
jgi:hypothetical protein